MLYNTEYVKMLKHIFPIYIILEKLAFWIFFFANVNVNKLIQKV